MNALKRINKIRDERKQLTVSDALKDHLQNKLNEFTDHLDEIVKTHLQDLVSRCYPILYFEIHTEAEVRGSTTYVAKDKAIIIGNNALAEYEEIEITKETLRKEKFATLAEINNFCLGTKELQGLLLQYDYIQTPTATIVATPVAYIHKNNVPVFREEDFSIYNSHPERSVCVSVIYENGFVLFGFTEKVKKNKNEY